MGLNVVYITKKLLIAMTGVPTRCSVLVEKKVINLKLRSPNDEMWLPLQNFSNFSS